MKHCEKIALLVAISAAFGLSSSGCSRGDDTPEGAVKVFLRASAAGDSARLYAMLTPDVQKWFRERARIATAHIGGRRRLDGPDMLAASLTKPRKAIGTLETIEQKGDRARVKLSDSKGKYAETWTLRRIDGKWRVRLPGPPAEKTTP